MFEQPFGTRIRIADCHEEACTASFAVTAARAQLPKAHSVVALGAPFCVTVDVQVSLVDPEAFCCCRDNRFGAWAVVFCRLPEGHTALGTFPSGPGSGAYVGEGVDVPPL